MTEEGFKQKFRSVTPELGEATTQFIARLENYLMIWIDVANIDKDFDGLLSLTCLLYTSPSPRDRQKSRMPSSA